MPKLEKRITALEARSPSDDGRTIAARFINPVDMGVVAELVLEPGHEPVWREVPRENP